MRTLVSTAALALAAATIVAAAADSAFAHGGEYSPPPLYRPKKRDAGPPDAPPPPGPGPTTGGGLDPTTAPADGKLGPDPWRNWWTSQRRSLLRTRPDVAETASSPQAAATGWRAEAVAALARSLADPDDDVATAALVALGKAGGPWEPDLVRALLDTRRTQTAREAATCGLALLGPATPPAPSPEGAAAVAQTTPSARAALEEVALDVSAPPRLRAFGVYALGLRGSPESGELLLGLLHMEDTDPQVAAAAAGSLGLLATPEARAALRRVLATGRPGDPDSNLARVYAAQGLALAGDADAVTDLRKALADPDPALRRAAAYALGALAAAGDDATQLALRRVLDTDPDVTCRDAAVLALGRQGHAGSWNALADALKGGRNVHLTFAATALGFHARRNPGGPAVATLRRALGGASDPEVRGALCVALALARDRAAAPLVLSTATGAGDPWTRACAIAALAEIGTPGETAPPLRRLLDAAEPPAVRREAAVALGALGDAGAAAALQDLVAHGDSLYLRAAAVVSLGRVGGPAAAASLVRTLDAKDESAIVRAMAAVGLGILLDRPRDRPLHVVGRDLDGWSATEAAAEMLSIL